jgi:hypothetical protein
MAVRTDHDSVLEIMDNCVVSHTVIDRLIIAASAVIDQVFENDSDIGDTLLEEIECFLTAHMIACTLYRTTSEEKIGDATAKYTGQWGKKLESTPYGQMCLILDTTGKMARSGKIAASIFAVVSFDE